MNLFQDIPSDLPDELFTELLNQPGVRIERIVSAGHKSDPDFWYNQDEQEWICLIQGEAELEFQDQAKQKLIAGDTLLIPAHQKHRVNFTSSEPPCIWLAIFFEASNND